MSFIEIEYREQKKSLNMADVQAHDFYEIYYLLHGERQLFIEDKIFTLRENSIAIIPPFYMHKTEGGPYERINLYISDDLLDEHEKRFLTAAATKLAFEIDDARREVLLSLFRPFLSAGDKLDFLKKSYSLSFAKVLLYFLQSSPLTPQNPARASKSNTSKDVVLDVVAYINTHFREEITLELLKNKFFISKNTLCKNFQRVMSCSVIEYCAAVRLNESRLLLLTTDKSIEDIADLCGYSSANYFSLFFKSKMGISPSNYRKKK